MWTVTSQEEHSLVLLSLLTLVIQMAKEAVLYCSEGKGQTKYYFFSLTFPFYAEVSARQPDVSIRKGPATTGHVIAAKIIEC